MSFKLPFVDLARQQRIIRKQIKRRIKKVMSHGQYISGPETFELEERLADFVSIKHCIGASSGTDALVAALLSKNIGRGDEVITTPFTFISTAEAIIRAGADVVFSEINDNTYNIDTEKVKEKITPKTKAIIGVSLFGQCFDFEPLLKICKENEITLIEDAAQSFGALYKGEKSCSIADISCTSFFPAKPLGCYGDGGACFTNNTDTAERIRQTINHGQNSQYSYSRRGINGRLDTIQAAILLEKLKIFPEEITKRIEVAKRYTKLLKDHVRTPVTPDYNSNIYSQYTIEVENRNYMEKELSKKGVPTAIYYPIPLYCQKIFQKFTDLKDSFPITDIKSKKVLSLPMHPYLKEKEQDFIVDTLKQSLTDEKLCLMESP